MKVLIIGGGLFGSLAAHCCVRAGHEVVVLDDARPGRASPAAACVYKDSWLGPAGRHARLGVETLERMFRVRDVPFVNERSVEDPLRCVSLADMLWRDPLPRHVTSINPDSGAVETDAARIQADAIYVATGYWASELVTGLPPIVGKGGWAVSFAGEINPPRIAQWAPYRQQIGFVREPGSTYFSDGQGLVPHRINPPKSLMQCLERAARFDLRTGPTWRHLGYRPFVEGGPLFRKVGRRAWVGTGGMRVGTVLGAAFGAMLVKELS